MYKRYKGKLFISTLTLTVLLAGCGSVNRESDEAVQGSSIGAALRKKTEEVASQAADIVPPEILQATDNCIEDYIVDDDGQIIISAEKYVNLITEDLVVIKYLYLEIKDEIANKFNKLIHHTVLDGVLEDDAQINISAAKYVKLTTEDLVVIEYPYLDSEDEIAYQINEQIYNTILDGVLEDDGWTDRADVTYEITYVDDKILSIHFTGYKMKGIYANGGVYEIGMVFNLRTGDLLCLADVYSLAEIQTLFDTAISEGRIEGWIAYEALPFSQDELEEYIHNTFFKMIERENYINEPGHFFLKEGKICFLSEPYPSMHDHTCFEIEIEEFP